MTDFTAIAENYLEIWNETDADIRAKAVAALFAPDASYIDPLAAVTGHDGIGGFIAAAQEQFAGLRFRLLGAVDGHHTIARFSWELVSPAGGESIVIGFDVIEVNLEGQIVRIAGFLDKVPA